MSVVLIGLVLTALLVLALWFPPAVVFVYALTCATDDARGLSSFLRAHDFGLLLQLARGPFLVAVAVSFFRLWSGYRRRRVSERTWLLACTVAGCCVWIVVGSILKLEQVLSIPGILLSTGLPASMVAMAYYRNRAARILFVVMLVLQLSLSILILMYPDGPMAQLSALKYELEDQGLVGRRESLEGRMAGLTLETRLFAQHHNPHAYGFYALVGLAVGGYMFLAPATVACWLGGLGLLAIGLFGWLMTIPRAATVGLLVGILSVLPRLLRPSRRKSWAKGGIVVAACLVGGGLLIPSLSWEALGPKFDIDVGLRMEAALAALTEVAANPLFGISTERFDTYRLPAHQIPLYFATAFGIPVGLCGFWFLWRAVASTFVAFRSHRPAGSASSVLSRRGSIGERNLGLVLGWLLVGLGLSNNTAAPILFWLAWPLAWMPWALPTHPGAAGPSQPEAGRVIVSA